jgi:hypothetical protein
MALYTVNHELISVGACRTSTSITFKPSGLLLQGLANARLLTNKYNLADVSLTSVTTRNQEIAGWSGESLRNSFSYIPDYMGETKYHFYPL